MSKDVGLLDLDYLSRAVPKLNSPLVCSLQLYMLSLVKDTCLPSAPYY